MARAFIVGNGPSLTSAQLDKLRDEITYGVNRIHLIYDQTKWRPTYWTIMDFSNSLFFEEDIKLHSLLGYECHIRSDILAKYFEWCIKNRDMPIMDNLHVLERCTHIDVNRYTSEGWHEPLCQMGGSVPASIQMAVDKGYNPIYLIGMDGDRKGNAENNFINGYIDKDAVTVQKAMIANDTQKLSLSIAKRECSERGVQLIDATVGGSAYKVLPEVDFYDL